MSALRFLIAVMLLATLAFSVGPTAPTIVTPTVGSIGLMNISYQQSNSTDNKTILYYNISLMNSGGTFNKTIVANNSLNLTYQFNASSTKFGSYFIQVTAYDNASQTATANSSTLSLGNASLTGSVTLVSNVSDYGSPSLYNFLPVSNTVFDCNGFSVIGTNLAASYGIFTSSANNFTIKNCIITNFSTGVYFYLGSTNTITNSTVIGVGSGIISTQNGATIVNSNISGGATAISLSAAMNTLITNSSVFNTAAASTPRYGIGVAGGSNNTRIINVSVGSIDQSAIYITGSKNNLIDCLGGNVVGNNYSTSYGVYVGDAVSSNITTQNCNFSNWETGVYYYGAPDSLIQNVNATGSKAAPQIYLYGSNAASSSLRTRVDNVRAINLVNSYGMYIRTSANATISNVYSEAHGYRACEFDTSTGATFTNGVCNNTGGQAGFFIDSINVTIINVTGYSNTQYGIHSNTARTNITLINCTGVSNSSIGLELDTPNSNVIGTIGNSTSGSAIYISGGNVSLDCRGRTIVGTNTSTTSGIYTTQFNTTIKNCNIRNFPYGINLVGATNGTFTNDTVFTSTTGAAAMYVSSGSGNVFSDLILNATGASSPALYRTGGVNGVMTRITADSAQSDAVQAYNGVGAIIANSTLISRSATGYAKRMNNVTSATAINITFINTAGGGLVYLNASSANNTFCLSNFSATSGLYVNDTNGSNFYNCSYNGLNQGNAWADVINNSVVVYGINSSSISGLYIGNTGAGYPYNITKSSKFSCNFTGCADYAPLTSNLLSACRDLNESGTVYNLTYSTTALNTTCFAVKAPNITLDCAGYSITGNNASGIYAVYSNQTNTTIKNCKISNFAVGIYFDAVTASQIADTTVAGTYSSDAAGNGTGVLLVNSNGNIIKNVSINVTQAVGLLLSSSSGNTINLTSIIGFNPATLYQGGSNNLFVNSVTTATDPLTVIDFGIYLNNSNGNVFRNSTFHNRADMVVYTMNSSNTLFTNCTSINSDPNQDGGGFGFVIHGGTNNTINNTYVKIGDDGIWLRETNDSKIYNVFVNSSQYNTINVEGSNYTDIQNSTIIGGVDVLIITGGSWNSFKNLVVNGSGEFTGSGVVTLGGSIDYGNPIGVLLQNATVNNAGNPYAFYIANADRASFSGITATSDQIGLFFESAINNVFANSTIIGADPVIRVQGSNNTFMNNTIVSTAGGTLLSIASGAVNNTVCLDTFNATSGSYIDSGVAGNRFNCTYDGKNQGNIYPNVLSGTVGVAGTQNSTFSGLYIGTNGAVPYTANSSGGKFVGSGGDYAPLTNNTDITRFCRVLNVSGATYNLSNNITVADATCFTVTAPNVTLDCKGYWLFGNNASQTNGVFSDQNYTTIQNCNIENFSQGIFLLGGQYGHVNRVYAKSTHNNNFYDEGMGINIKQASRLLKRGFNLVENSYFYASQFDAVFPSNTFGDVFRNVSGYSDSMAVDYTESQNVTIIDSNFTCRSECVYQYESYNLSIINSTATATEGSAVEASLSEGTRIIGGHYYAPLSAVTLDSSPYTTVDGVTGVSDTSPLYVFSSDYAMITNSVFTGANAIAVESSNYGLYRNNSIDSPDGNSVAMSGTGNVFCLNKIGSTVGLYASDSGTGNQYNCTYDGKNQGNAWYDIYGAIVEAYGTVPATVITDGSGDKLYIGTWGAGVPYDDFSSGGMVAGVSDPYPLTPAYESQGGCPTTYDVPNSVWFLVANEDVAKGSCITIQAPNVTIDCGGHRISGKNESGTFGIYTDQPGTVIKNCIITNFSTGIEYATTAATGGIVNNVTVNTTHDGNYGEEGCGLNLFASTGATVTNSTFYSASVDPLPLQNSHNNIIDNVTVDCAHYCIDLTSANNNTFKNIRAHSTVDDAFYNAGGSNNSAYNLTLTSGTGAPLGIDSAAGTMGTGNLVSNASVITGGAVGAYINGASNDADTIFENLFINASGTGGSAFDITGINNITIRNSIIRGADGGISFSLGSGHNLVINNTIVGNTSIISFDAADGENTLCLNNISGIGTYVLDSNGSNIYSCVYAGMSQGNAWANVLNGTVNVTGPYNSSIRGLYVGQYGKVPYNSTNSLGKVSAGVSDPNPLTRTYEASHWAANGENFTIGFAIPRNGTLVYSLNFEKANCSIATPAAATVGAPTVNANLAPNGLTYMQIGSGDYFEENVKNYFGGIPAVPAIYNRTYGIAFMTNCSGSYILNTTTNTSYWNGSNCAGAGVQFTVNVTPKMKALYSGWNSSVCANSLQLTYAGIYGGYNGKVNISAT